MWVSCRRLLRQSVERWTRGAGTEHMLSPSTASPIFRTTCGTANFNCDRKIGFSQERVNGTDQFTSAGIELHLQRAIVVVQSLPQRGRDRRRIPFLGAAQEPGGIDPRAVGEDGEVCQAEVDADAPVGVGHAGGVGVRAATSHR